MAKLSARGRTERARLTRERAFCHTLYTERAYEWGKAPVYCALTAGHAGDHAGDGLTSWERVTRALMSDGAVLEKLDVRFPDHARYGGSDFHSYGWKMRGKARPGVTPEQFRAVLVKAGWTEVS